MKTKFTKADVSRFCEGLRRAHFNIATVEIKIDGSILATAKEATVPTTNPEDDPDVSRKLL